jgi:hypothetical protein
MTPNTHSTVEEVFDWLVQQHDRAEKVCDVDFQMASYRKNPERYILPNACKWMTALIEAYGDDSEAWLQFVRRLTNEFAKRSEDRMALQEVYRGIDSRVDGQLRRERGERAINAHKQVHGELGSRADELAYAKYMTRIWKLGRMNALGVYKNNRGLGKVPADERREVFSEYWDSVRAKIDAGDIPSQEQLPKAFAEVAKVHRLYYGDKPENRI